MTKLRALLLALVLTGGALTFGPASPASADTDIGAYTDCASALAVGSAQTGRMACFDRVTNLGPIFQVFSNWTLYYAAPFSTPAKSSVLANHRWLGNEWVVSGHSGSPANGRTFAGDSTRKLTTWDSNLGMPIWQTWYAWSSDPGLRSWWYYAAADATLNVIWIDR